MALDWLEGVGSSDQKLYSDIYLFCFTPAQSEKLCSRGDFDMMRLTADSLNTSPFLVMKWRSVAKESIVYLTSL